MSMFRSWTLSIAIHAALGAVAFLTITGIAGQDGTPDEPEATYEVTIRPGGGPKIEDAPRGDEYSYGITQDTVTIDETPLTGVPDLRVASEAPATTTPGRGVPPRAIQHGAVAKFSKGVGEGRDAGIEAVPLETPSPVYPEAARRGNLQGIVIAEIRIDPQGRVESARAAEGSGSAILDDAALAAVKSWRYRPAHLSGKPVSSVRRVRFVFRLE